MISIATGVDLVEIKRFENLNPLIMQRFFQRVFSPTELAEASLSFQRLAGKFAAKEAASKALGCGIGLVSWHDLEILNDPEGKPQLILHGNANLSAQEAGWTTWSVSISHTQTHALAMVTALTDNTKAKRDSG
jgi:holo-[acyl-carrier protein] synthase